MSDRVRIELRPLGQVLDVDRGASLQEILFAHGVEFPCGGQGQCKGCRVRLLDGDLPITADQERILSPDELSTGWRLACRCQANDDLAIEIAQWQASILSDDSPFAFTPREGFSIAVDLGTTTLVAQLLDMTTASVLAVRTARNPQARHGGDVMSRVQFAVAENGQRQLEALIRRDIERLILELIDSQPIADLNISTVNIVGNTVMHHLFCGIDIEPLSRFPFQSAQDGLMTFRSQQLQWNLPGDPVVRFLPCLGGFVGSDLLAGILATRMHESDDIIALIDLGTNGEIVVGNRNRILCASTAAGPAFEGARISMGMQAATGAIAQVWPDFDTNALRCHVIGGGAPRGICGSGLVDAVAASLDLGWIRPDGRIADRSSDLTVCNSVLLSQCDIRELQLAKAAIAAGTRMLVKEMGITGDDLARVYLAGAFGNYVNRASAQRIGLLDFDLDITVPAGNTALLGVKLALFTDDAQTENYAHLRSKIKHISLSEDPEFQDTFINAMAFPKIAAHQKQSSKNNVSVEKTR